MVGDFNAHHSLWTTRREACPSGTSLVTAIQNNDLQLLTPQNMATYIDNRTGRPSTLDLCFLSNRIYPSSAISLSADIGSDHCHVCIEVEVRPQSNPVKGRFRWILEETNWITYKELFPEELDNSPMELNNRSEALTHMIQQVALKTFKKTSPLISCKYNKEWWNESCSRAVALRRRARAVMSRHPTRQNIEHFRRVTAETRRVIEEQKKESFKKFCNTLTAKTPVATVGKKIKTFQNKTNSMSNIPLIDNNTILVNAKEKAEKFKQRFEIIYRSAQRQLTNQQRQEIIIAKTETEAYNAPFSNDELSHAMLKLKDTAPGKDNILNSFIKKSTRYC